MMRWAIVGCAGLVASCAGLAGLEDFHDRAPDGSSGAAAGSAPASSSLSSGGAASGGTTSSSASVGGAGGAGGTPGSGGCPPSCPYKRVFVTSDGFTGDFDFDKAQRECELRGKMLAGSASTWKPWLAPDNMQGAGVVVQDVGGPWYRADCAAAVATSKQDLSDGLDAAIDRDEHCQLVRGFVWTGSLASGVASGAHCNAWTDPSPAESGTVGVSSAIDDTAWSASDAQSCAAEAHLYCFEQ